VQRKIVAPPWISKKYRRTTLTDNHSPIQFQ